MAIEEIIDRLYGLPLAEFTGARNEAASELRKAGQREAAARVKALPKPTVAAAAVNRLVREHRGEVEQFLHAAAVLRDAQFAGKGDLAAATEQEREGLERLIDSGGEAIRQTLLAAAADEDAAQQLLEARLVRELELTGFGTLLAYASLPALRTTGRPAAERTRPTPAPAPQAPPEKKPDDRAAIARLQDTKAVLSAAETEERHARSRWQETQKELEKARATVEEAQRDLDRLRAQ